MKLDLFSTLYHHIVLRGLFLVGEPEKLTLHSNAYALKSNPHLYVMQHTMYILVLLLKLIILCYQLDFLNKIYFPLAPLKVIQCT